MPIEKYIDDTDNIEGGRKMKSDLDKHIERQLKDKEFRIYFDKAETKRILASARYFPTALCSTSLISSIPNMSVKVIHC